MAAQLVELYLKANPGLDKSINLNDMIRMSQVIEEAGKIAGLYVSSVEKMLKAHPQTVRNYWRFRATDWWYNNKWPWFGPEVDHYKLGACNCLEWAEQVYSDVAGNRGTTEFRHFDLYKGNSTSWYGYQHNFVVITPKNHGPALPPGKTR